MSFYSPPGFIQPLPDGNFLNPVNGWVFNPRTGEFFSPAPSPAARTFNSFSPMAAVSQQPKVFKPDANAPTFEPTTSRIRQQETEEADSWIVWTKQMGEKYPQLSWKQWQQSPQWEQGIDWRQTSRQQVEVSAPQIISESHTTESMVDSSLLDSTQKSINAAPTSLESEIIKPESRTSSDLSEGMNVEQASTSESTSAHSETVETKVSGLSRYDRRQLKKEKDREQQKIAAALKSQQLQAIKVEREIKKITTPDFHAGAQIVSADDKKEPISFVQVGDSRIPIKSFSQNQDGTSTAALEGYTVTGIFNEGVLQGEAKINYKGGATGRNTTHTYEGPVTVFNSKIVRHGMGIIKKDGSEITATFVNGEIVGDAIIRYGAIEYTGLVDGDFSPTGEISLEYDNCRFTGVFNHQLKLCGAGEVVCYGNADSPRRTVVGSFDAGQIAGGIITLPNGDFYKGKITKDYKPDAGIFYYSSENQPKFQPELPNSIQYLTCVRNRTSNFSWTARIGIFSECVTITGFSRNGDKPHGVCKINTQDEKVYEAEFKEGVLITLQTQNAIIYFTTGKQAILLMKLPETIGSESVNYFGKIQPDTLLMHDPQGVLIKTAMTEDSDFTQTKIQAFNFGHFEAGKITHVAYYVPTQHAVPELQRITSVRCAQLKAINYQQILGRHDEMPNLQQFYLLYEGGMRGTSTNVAWADSGPDSKSIWNSFGSLGQFYSCEARFIGGFAQDENARLVMNDMTFSGGMDQGTINGNGIFRSPSHSLAGGFTSTSQVLVPISEPTEMPKPVSLPLHPPKPSPLYCSMISIIPGALLDDHKTSALLLHEIPEFEAFISPSTGLRVAIFKLDY